MQMAIHYGLMFIVNLRVEKKFNKTSGKFKRQCDPETGTHRAAMKAYPGKVDKKIQNPLAVRAKG